MRLRVADAARLLGVQPEVVLDWIRDRELPARRLGRHFHIDSTELQAWAREKRVPIAPPESP